MTDTRARVEMMVEDWYTMHDDIKANVAQRRELIGCIDRALADERRRALEEAAKVVQEYKLPTGESIAGDKMNRYLDGIAVDILAQAQAGPEEGKTCEQ